VKKFSSDFSVHLSIFPAMKWILALAAVAVIVFLVARWYGNRHLSRYSIDETQQLLASGEGMLLDVRTDAERAEKAIPGSLHIPLDELPTRIDELEKYRDREIIAYCRSGNRSLAATEILSGQGFRAASMKGGIMSWQEPEKRVPASRKQ
jgi:rhodanese-related sulfurtransferase